MAKKESNTKSKEKSAKKTNDKPAEKTVEKPSANPVDKTDEKDNSKKTKLALIICAVVAGIALIIGVIVAALCLNQTDPADPRASLTYSKSFFIYDDDKYTLWDADGKRVNEEEYSNQSNFVGGYAMVKKDNQYGIIRENGSLSIDFGKYGNITAKSGLFLAQDGNTKEYSLLTGAGNELAKGSELKVFTPNSFSGFAAVIVDNKIKVFNYEGKLVKEFDVDDKATDPVLSGQKDYGLFHYGDQNLLIDARDGRVLAEFEGPRYVFDSVSDSRKVIILENYDNDGDYKLFKNDRLYDLNEAKNYSTTALDDVIGYDNYSELALLNDEYKIEKKVSTYLELKDSKNYAVENDEGNVEIYQNGEKTKDFGEDSSISSSGVLYDDLYAIEVDGKNMFYRLDGSVAINHEYEDIYSLFDKFHHAIVADEEKAYYLINTNGDQISETYKRISSRDGGYELRDSDDKYAIANTNGEKITDNKYDSVYYRSNAEPHNIWTGRNDYDDYDVIDINSGKVIIEHVNIDSFYTHYFTVKKDGKVEYYTYDGLLFYTAEK